MDENQNIIVVDSMTESATTVTTPETTIATTVTTPEATITTTGTTPETTAATTGTTGTTIGTTGTTGTTTGTTGTTGTTIGTTGTTGTTIGTTGTTGTTIGTTGTTGTTIGTTGTTGTTIGTTPTPTGTTPTPTPTGTTPTPSPTTYINNVGFCFNIISETGNELKSDNNIISINFPDLSSNKLSINYETVYFNEIPTYRTNAVNLERLAWCSITIKSDKYSFKVKINDKLLSGSSTQRNISLSSLILNKLNEITIILLDNGISYDDVTSTNVTVDKMFYEVESSDAELFKLSPYAKNSIGVVLPKNPNDINEFGYLIMNGKRIGLTYEQYINNTNAGLPIFDNATYNTLKYSGKLPSKYIVINSEKSVYNKPESSEDQYIVQMFSAIRSLQAEITKLKNTFKYGLESYQGKQTAMSNVVGELENDNTKTVEPLWGVDEHTLSEITDFIFDIAENHQLTTEEGDITFDNNKLKVNGIASFQNTLFKGLTDSYVYLYFTTNNLNISIQFNNVEDPNDTFTVDYSKLGLASSTKKQNILVVLSRAHAKELDDPNTNYFGKNYLYTSITFWDNNETRISGYIDKHNPKKLLNTEKLFTDNDGLKFNRYYPNKIFFKNTEIYKFNAYTRYKDFSNTVLPTIPTTDTADRYKVAHISIRSFETLQEAKDIKNQLLENELFLIEATSKLYIKSKGNIIGISGAGSSDDTDNDINIPNGEDITMTQEQLLQELEKLGIIYTSETGSIELSKLSDITFIHNGSGKEFNFECNAYGELVGSEVRHDTLANRINAVKESFGNLSNDYEDCRGLIGQLHMLEAEKISASEAGKKDAGINSDRVYIGSMYCPLSTDKVFGCTHGFIELANASDKDLNLEGCYLSHCYMDSEKTMHTVSLPLKGILPGGGTFLIRCKQYANASDLNTFINVDKYDMEWYVNGELLDLTIHKEYSDDNSHGFLLTFGNTIAGNTISNLSKPYDKGVNSTNTTVSGNKDATYCFVNNFIDSVVLLKTTNCKWAEKAVSVLGNSITKVTFMLDPAKQAVNCLYAKDSSRIRWQNTTTDFQSVTLNNEFISFKHSQELYPVKNYTPQPSFNHKNVCTDKSKLNTQKPNCVYTAFGIDNLTTRCFSWISVGVFDEYVWIKDGDNYIKFESYKTLDADVEQGEGYPVRKEFPYELNNAAYARIVQRFPAENSLFSTHKCIIQLVQNAVSVPTKFEYIVGRADKNGNPDFAHCSDVMSFTLYPANYKPVIYHTSDQQGFHWIEYQVWNAAAKKLEEKIKSDCEGKELYPVIINTGDMTQNGTRINEWLDYYNGGYNLFSQYEHAAVVGNNDLCNTNTEILGTGDDIGKSNSFFFHLFFCYETDITKNDNDEYNIPLPIVNGKYIPSLYYFNIGQNNRIIMINSEITKVNCEQWFKLVYNNKPVNIYTGFTIDSGIKSVYAADELQFTPIYEMLYKMTADNKYKYITVCHEAPFTVITNASLKTSAATSGATVPYSEDRSLSGTSLVGCHMNIIHADSTNAPGLYWFSRLLEFRGIKLCLCGHKHTYACTHPIRENFQFFKDGEWHYSKNEQYVMPASLKEEYNESLDNHSTIKWIWDDAIVSESNVWKNVNHTKFPLINMEITYGSNDPSEFLPGEYVSNLTNGVRYFMCQATGYKLTSNKELPSPKQIFSEFIPITVPGTSKDTPDNNQKYPMFAIITIEENNIQYKVKLARIANILKNYTFTQQSFTTDNMELEYLVTKYVNLNKEEVSANEGKPDGYGKWVSANYENTDLFIY